jgi:hypothetical protein
VRSGDVRVFKYRYIQSNKSISSSVILERLVMKREKTTKSKPENSRILIISFLDMFDIRFVGICRPDLHFKSIFCYMYFAHKRLFSPRPQVPTSSHLPSPCDCFDIVRGR